MLRDKNGPNGKHQRSSKEPSRNSYRPQSRLRHSAEPTAKAIEEPQTVRPAFEKLRVSEVFCPSCRSSQAVQEILNEEQPSLTRYHIVCKTCSSVVGQRTLSDLPVPPSSDVQPSS